ncbi:hypothetical protein BN13_250030 [Nostocoides jenkinsii Ben 74]|uniref:Uncharacterized protein n=1 Tax=Nostocoides jenkinsii Ben 74 TaxID=1193518 RepID=A0A077MDI8_9MICO|nr:hypothetical protein BN13_250030 [Tetrasphaera jenkinsii Ben 74]
MRDLWWWARRDEGYSRQALDAAYLRGYRWEQIESGFGKFPGRPGSPVPVPDRSFRRADSTSSLTIADLPLVVARSESARRLLFAGVCRAQPRPADER